VSQHQVSGEHVSSFSFFYATQQPVVESRLVFLTYPNSNCLFVVMPLYSLFRPVFWKVDCCTHVL